MNRKKRCPFCVSNGKVNILAETDLAYLTQALNPAWPGSYLINPKAHITNSLLLPDTWQREVSILLQKIPRFEEFPYNLSMNQGEEAGQKIPHLHLWYIPRNPYEEAGTKVQRIGAATALARLKELLDPDL